MDNTCGVGRRCVAVSENRFRCECLSSPSSIDALALIDTDCHDPKEESCQTEMCTQGESKFSNLGL